MRKPKPKARELKTTTTVVRMQPSLKAALAARAEAEERTISQVVCRLLREALR